MSHENNVFDKFFDDGGNENGQSLLHLEQRKCLFYILTFIYLKTGVAKSKIYAFITIYSNTKFPYSGTI